jgi:hypothetical protein
MIFLKSRKIDWAVSCFAHVSVEHEVEGSRFSEILGAASGAFDLLLADRLGHVLQGHRIGASMKGPFDQMVAAETTLAHFAVDQGIVEPFQVAGSLPGFGVEEDRPIEAHQVAPPLDEFFPP